MTNTNFKPIVGGDAVQAIQYRASHFKIPPGAWAGIDKDGNAAIYTDGDFTESALAFPINHGAGMTVDDGWWIVRLSSAAVQTLSPTEFAALYVPAEG